MSISDLYPTGLHEQNLSHFAALVRIALRDNQIDSKEKILLERLSLQLDISKAQFQEIMKNPMMYSFVSPVSYEERLEHFFDLSKMLFLDRNPTIDKTSLLDRIAVELGFPIENARQVVKAATNFFLKDPNLEEFKQTIKKVNPMHH